MRRIINLLAVIRTGVSTFWAGLTRQKKLGILTALVIVLAGGLLARAINPAGQKQKKSDQEQISKSVNDGFTRLEIAQRETPYFVLEPVTQNKFGILPKQTFILKTKDPIDQEFLKSHLKTSVPFEIVSVSDKEFRLTPSAPVSLGQMVNLAILVKDSTFSSHTFDRDYKWAYQTQGKFRITGSLPGDQKKDVPLNTGIELTFSQDDYEDPTPLLSVSPDFKYRTERHGESWAIIPLSPLSPKTVYNITLKKGLNISSRNDPITENFSFLFQTQEPKTEKPAPRLSIYDSFIQMTPQEPPIVKIYTSSWTADESVRAEIYQFASGEEFIKSRKNSDTNSSRWYRYYPEDEKTDTSGLSLTATADLTPQSRDQINYLQLPEPLKPGWYLIEFWYAGHTKVQQVWVQSNFTSGYVSAGRFQTLAWANDLQASSAIAGARVRVAGEPESHYTSGNGVAAFTSPGLLFETGSHYLEIASPSGTSLYLPLRSLAGNENGGELTANDYWSYVYHERTMYKPTDTVNVWGVVKNRDTGLAPGAVTVSLIQGYGSGQNPVVTNKTLGTDADGAFSGNIEFSDLPAGWYRLSASVSGVEISSSGLQILEYEKPEIKIEVSADKKAVFTGETVVFTAKSAFYDGTPVRDVKLNIWEEMTGKKKEMTTDNQGEIIYQYIPQYSGSYYPRYENITINPALAQKGKVEGDGSVRVFGSRLAINSHGNQDKNQAQMTAVVNQVDLTGINSGLTGDSKGPPAINTDVAVTITKNWWEKVEDGTYYDFIEKITRPAYHYVHHSEKIFDQKIKTGSDGSIAHQFTMEKGYSYNAIMRVTDRDGHAAQSSEYFYYWSDSDSTNINSYSPAPQLTLNSKDNTYSLGETVEAVINQDGKAFPNRESDRFLFIIARRGRQDFYVESQPQTSFKFAEKYIPNMSVGAVIFSGGHYQPVSGGCDWNWYCNYDFGENYFNGVETYYRKDDQKLDVTMAFDKQQYQPGESANVRVKVTKNQVPAAGSEVNLLLVDQALAALGAVIKPSTLNSLYKTVPIQIYYAYYSHKAVFPDNAGGGAEMGGGGGESRELFKDTAFFGRTKTDEAGTASFTFTLPDNITTWLVYSQAVTGDLKAGQTESSMTVSKDFFVTNQFPTEYLLSDKPVLTTTGFGTALKNGDNINYQAVFLEGDQQRAKAEKTGGAFGEIFFPAPALETGNYKAWIKGTAGELTDGVIYPFKIIDSRISFGSAKKYSLTQGGELNSPDLGKYQSDKPVKMVISDTGKGTFYYQLMNFCYTGSNRLEKKITAIKAAEILDNRFDEKQCLTAQDTSSLRAFQNDDGGLGQVWWGGSNLETTVWTINTDATAFDKASLINYLEDKLNHNNSGSRQQIYAAWGLSLLGRPQINKLKLLADNSRTFEERVLSAIALAYLGETEKSRDLYLDILADYAYSYKPYIRIQRDSSGNLDSWLKDTSYALLLGSLTDKTYDSGMYAYMKGYGQYGADVVLDLSSMAFIDEEMAKLPQEDTRITVTSPLIQKTINLNKGRSEAMVLDSSQISNLKLKVDSGRAEVNLHYYLGSEGLASIQKDGRLSVKRSYKKIGGDGAIRPGDIIRVTLEPDTYSNAPLGSYQIIDFLPSGLVYLNNPSAYGLGNNSYMSQSGNNQKLIGYWANSPWWPVTSIVYYARAAFAGTYTAEPAIFQSNLEPSVFQTTGPDLVTIGENL